MRRRSFSRCFPGITPRKLFAPLSTVRGLLISTRCISLRFAVPRIHLRWNTSGRLWMRAPSRIWSCSWMNTIQLLDTRPGWKRRYTRFETTIQSRLRPDRMRHGPPVRCDNLCIHRAERTFAGRPFSCQIGIPSPPRYLLRLCGGAVTMLAFCGKLPSSFERAWSIIAVSVSR